MKHRIPGICLALTLLLLCALSLSACKETPAADKDAVTSVTLSSDGTTITVKAQLTQSRLASYKQSKVYLLELPSHCNTDDPLTGLTPVAVASPNSSLTFSFEAKDGMRSRLYSSYLLASQNPDGASYTALTTPMTLSNPEAAAVVKTASSQTSSLKGLLSDCPADAIRLGISHTIVDVYPNELMMDGYSEGAVSYIANGLTAYVDGERLAALDETIRTYTNADVQVFLRFRLTEKNKLAFPAASDSALEYAVDMSRPASAVAMEGFLHFMADRYASPRENTRPVEAFIMGYHVNNPSLYAAAGDISPSAAVANYEKLVHAAFVALRSHNAAGRVYISLDDHRTAEPGNFATDIPGYLSSFRTEAALRGEYDWHIACELHADVPAIWVENTGTDNLFYTVHSIGTLTDLLSGETYRAPSGEARRLLISGVSIPAAVKGSDASDKSASEQAASYAFLYLTARHNGHIEALIYDCYLDAFAHAADGALCGLMTAPKANDGTPLPGDKRQIYTVFRQCGTTDEAKLSTSLSDMIGTPYTKLSSMLAGTAAPVTSMSGTPSVGPLVPDRRNTSPVLTFDNGSLGGFEDAGELSYAELVSASELNAIVLRGRFNRASVGRPMALTTTLTGAELKGSENLLVDLRAAACDGTGSKVAVTLRLSRPATGTDSSGNGALVYESSASGVDCSASGASGSEWQTVTFPVADFTERLADSDRVTLTLYMDAPSGLSYELELAGLHVTNISKSAKGSFLPVVIIIVVVALLAGGLGAYILIFRKRGS